MRTNQTAITLVHESGAWRHYEALLAAAAERGLPVRCCTLNFAKRLIWSCRRLQPGQALGVGRDAGHLLWLLLARPRTVIAGVAPYGLWGILIGLLRRRHRVLYHSSWPRWRLGHVPRNPRVRLLERIWRRALRGAQAVCVTSRAARALADFGAQAVHIPHCVDVEAFHPAPQPRRGGKLVILFVGRIVAEKGIALIAETARRLHPGQPGIEWWFAGEGPLEQELAGAARSGVPIKLLGYLGRTELAEAYRRSDMLVLPSVSRPGWEELFGIAVIEAYASGLPVITSDCTGPTEIVENGGTGLVVPQQDVDAFHQAVEKLSRDPRLREEMGKRGRALAEGKYAVSAVSAQWAGLLWSPGC